MKPLLLLSIVYFCYIPLSTAQTSNSIKKVMDEQVNAWNDGDLVRYMNTYWNNDSMMFVGSKGVTYGWKNTLANYQKSYPDTAAMGKLSFDLIDIKKLSENYFYVTGKWMLVRSIGNLKGHFTLLFKKINNKWVIISDHSS